MLTPSQTDLITCCIGCLIHHFSMTFGRNRHSTMENSITLITNNFTCETIFSTCRFNLTNGNKIMVKSWNYSTRINNFSTLGAYSFTLNTSNCTCSRSVFYSNRSMCTYDFSYMSTIITCCIFCIIINVIITSRSLVTTNFAIIRAYININMICMIFSWLCFAFFIIIMKYI